MRVPKAWQLRAALKIDPRSMALYALHRQRLRRGYYELACPVGKWSDAPTLKGVSPFGYPTRESLLAVNKDPRQALSDAMRICGGEMLYFSWKWMARAGWHMDPLTGYDSPMVHWSRVKLPTAQEGDLKWIWEASRFDWAYLLGRAFAYSGDEEFAAGFWRLFEDWREQNPPNLGINWNCGQESSIRAIALIWSAGTFASSKTSTKIGLARLWEVVAKTAERVEASIGYAIAQNNNHRITECLCLYLAGVSMPEHPSSGRWQRVGLENIRTSLKSQFAGDGGYILNSTNYSRVALRLLTVAQTVARRRNEPIPDHLLARALNCAQLLFEMQDADTGRVPNYGFNDGSNLFPLTGCPSTDFRPAIQTFHQLVNRTALLPPGLYDEDLLWLIGEEKPPSRPGNPPLRSTYSSGPSGYHVLRSSEAFCFMRCGTHRVIPAHADMLHLDFWLNGQEILCDLGSFSYSHPKNWHEFFASTRAHNTVTVDGQDQMRRFRKYRWADWTRAQLVGQDTKDNRSCITGEHYGYRQIGLGVIHRRQVVLAGSELLVIDDLLNRSGQVRKLELAWHLASPSNWLPRENGALNSHLGLQLNLYADERFQTDFLCGADVLPETGRSLRYGQLDPILTLRSGVETPKSFRWITVLSKEPPKLESGAILFAGDSYPISPVSHPNSHCHS